MRRMSLLSNGLLIVALIGLVALPALAQAPAPQGTPTRVRGTVDKLDGKTLTVKSRDGQPVAVTLADDVSVIALVKKTLDDIKPGDFVVSTGIKDKDGKIHAIEVRILAKPLPDGGRQFPWDLSPDSVMTNATVGTITKTADGAVFHVTFKDGESDYTVGSDTVILANAPADASLLTPGVAVVLFALKHDDGSLTSRTVFAEKDGIKPPM
jgi:hypothetical protein